jgi:hypothetical protein
MATYDEMNADQPIEPADTMRFADGPGPTESDQLRLQRILDYAAQALAKSNVLESNLASINSGLLKMALWLEQTIEEATTRTPITPERMQRVYQAIDTHLRVARQIDRFSQIELRAAHPRESGPKARISVDVIGDNPSGPATRPSEDLSS